MNLQAQQEGVDLLNNFDQLVEQPVARLEVMYGYYDGLLKLLTAGEVEVRRIIAINEAEHVALEESLRPISGKLNADLQAALEDPSGAFDRTIDKMELLNSLMELKRK